MKKCILLILMVCMALLSGCNKPSTPVWKKTALPISAQREYTIIVGVPKDAGEVFSTDEQKVYRHEGGEYEIRTRVFTAESIEAAVRALVGEKAGKVSVVQLEKFDLPEYRFVWHSGENGAICSTDLVMDGKTCYAVTVEIDDAVCSKYGTLATEVFSTFGLFFDEGV